MDFFLPKKKYDRRQLGLMDRAAATVAGA